MIINRLSTQEYTFCVSLHRMIQTCTLPEDGKILIVHRNVGALCIMMTSAIKICVLITKGYHPETC